MAVPALLKSPYVLGSAGVVGVGGVSVVAVSNRGDGIDYSGVVQSDEKVLERKDLINRFSAGDLLKKERCFSEFFPNSEISLATNSLQSVTTTSTPQKPKDDHDSSSSPQACLFAQYSNLKSEAFIFQIETTVKNKNVGLSLWVFGSNVDYVHGQSDTITHKSTNNIRYYLAFLEKESDDNWSVKGGYSWHDEQFAYAAQERNLHINISGQEMYPGITKFSGISGSRAYVDRDWKHDAYFGRWEGNGSAGKEVFEGIELWRDSKVSAEILGRDYSQTFEAIKSGKGYGKSLSYDINTYEYAKKDSVSRWYIQPQIPTSTLDNWYKPFKGKKGKWVKTALGGQER